MDPAKADCKAWVLVFFVCLGATMSGLLLILFSVGDGEPPEMEPSRYRDLNLTHRYMSEEEWLSWFQEQRKKIVLLTAGPPFIVIAIIFLRPVMFFMQRMEDRRGFVNVPPINYKSSVKKYAPIFSTIVLLSVGLALTVVGNVVSSEFWLLRGCEICEEKNFQFQRQLKICRIVGPLVISFGVLLPIVCILYRHVKKKIGDDEDISDVIGQMLSKCLSCVPRTTTDRTESVRNPPEPHSVEPGDVPANPVTGSYPRNSAQQPEGQCVHPISTAQPSLTQCQNASPQIRQCYQPYREELPPPSYESVVNQNLALPNAPPLETSGISQGF